MPWPPPAAATAAVATTPVAATVMATTVRRTCPRPAGSNRLPTASLRDRIPPELQQRLADAVREVLLAVRALIDWYLERSERDRAEPRQVQDIPIL
jgi:hypothetical protein